MMRLPQIKVPSTDCVAKQSDFIAIIYSCSTFYKFATIENTLFCFLLVAELKFDDKKIKRKVHSFNQ